MEKIVYALWRSPEEIRERFNSRWLNETAPALSDHAHAVRLNIQDSEVLDGNSPRAENTKPAIEAVVQLWVDTAHIEVRRQIDEVVYGSTLMAQSWLVSESTPIVNQTNVVTAGERTPGFSQIVFLGLPPRITWAAWQEAWQTHHTEPAIETQSNFEYHQNLIVRPLTYGAAPYVAMVEECFPIEALNNPAIYFDAPDDPAKLEANTKRMMDSVARFIDHDRMDCFPTSQFDVKKLFA
ncbi:MAG: EthD domain-containing protein [Pseudomonadota bacterium]